MKIEPGYWRCRNGSKARVLCTDAPGDYPVVGHDDDSRRVTLFSWTQDGRFDVCGESSGWDLIEPWRDEPAQEQTVTLSLPKLRQLLIEASESGADDGPSSPMEIDYWLLKEGILPAPAKQQPVRVSGWFIVRRDTGINVADLFETRDEAARWQSRHHSPKYTTIVYVTGVEGTEPPHGTEGVGPEGDDQ